MAPAGNTLGQTPAMAFSPVESLESRMSLVSGVVETCRVKGNKREEIQRWKTRGLV